MNNKKILAFIAVFMLVISVLCIGAAVLLAQPSRSAPGAIYRVAESAELSAENSSKMPEPPSCAQPEMPSVDSGAAEPEPELALPPGVVVDTPIILVYDLKAEKAVYARNETELKAPASLAKLLTALVALEHLDEEQPLRVGEEIGRIGENSSIAFLEPGKRYRVKTLIDALLLPSGNDAAYVLAVNAARVAANDDSLGIDRALADFVRLMNEKAQSLGCYDSNFCTPDGYDAEGQVTTASDMLKIALAARKVRAIRETVAKPKSSGWENSNALLRQGSDYYKPEVTGMKTGSTDAAGFNIVVSADIDGGSYILIFMGSESAASRYKDAITFLDCIKYGGTSGGAAEPGETSGTSGTGETGETSGTGEMSAVQ